MPQRPLVVIADFLTEASIEGPILEDVADVWLVNAQTEEEVVRKTPLADVLLIYHELRWTAASLTGLPHCRAVIRCGVGFDNVDLAAAGELGIAVCNVPDYGTEEVADHALMLLLACARRLLPADLAIRRGVWDPALIIGTPRLRGQDIGIIGCGRIGTAFGRRVQALGMNPIFYDPYQPQGYEKALGFTRAHSLEELLRRVPFVSLHCPLTSETRHILNRATLALLPQGATVINTARGPCIELEALADLLDAGNLSWAGLDVVEREPLDYERIRQHPRVVLTPHAAFYSVEAQREMRTKGAEEARRVVLDEPVRNLVNRAYLRNPRCRIPEPRSL